MTKEESIAQELTGKFKYLEGNIKIPRSRRIFLEAEYKDFSELLDYCVKSLEFRHLCTITGLDEADKLSFIYHLAHESGIVLNIKVSLPKENPVLKSVMPYFPGAEIYERELVDLLGAKVEGLPSGSRYPLTDDWPVDQHPLRKDWKPAPEPEKEVGPNA